MRPKNYRVQWGRLEYGDRKGEEDSLLVGGTGLYVQERREAGTTKNVGNDGDGSRGAVKRDRVVI